MTSLVNVVQFNRDLHTNFILDAVLKSNRSGFDGAYSLTADYYAFREPYWKRVLGLPETDCLVATSPEAEDQFIGFVIGCGWGLPGKEPAGLLHYVYVKQPFRQFGVAKALISALPLPTIQYYSTIPQGWKWKKAREYEWRYEPHSTLARLYGDAEET